MTADMIRLDEYVRRRDRRTPRQRADDSTAELREFITECTRPGTRSVDAERAAKVAAQAFVAIVALTDTQVAR